MSIADPNKTIPTGENPFIRLNLKDGDPNSTGPVSNAMSVPDGLARWHAT
jgi:hypothetical protein